MNPYCSYQTYCQNYCYPPIAQPTIYCPQPPSYICPPPPTSPCQNGTQFGYQWTPSQVYNIRWPPSRYC